MGGEIGEKGRGLWKEVCGTKGWGGKGGRSGGRGENKPVCLSSCLRRLICICVLSIINIRVLNTCIYEEIDRLRCKHAEVCDSECTRVHVCIM